MKVILWIILAVLFAAACIIRIRAVKHGGFCGCGKCGVCGAQCEKSRKK